MTKLACSSPTGGSAAILGFLYQLQTTASRLIEARIQHGNSGSLISGIRAILEPKSGGDAILESDGRYCIQFKLRSRPIDVGALADSVLPDLFGAHCEQVCDRYEFQSNQRLTKPAAALLSRLRGETPPSSTNELSFQRTRKSCRAMFVKQCGSEVGFDEAFKVFAHRLHLAPTIDAAEVRNQLTQQIRPNIPYGDQTDAKLDQLVGTLLKRASANGNIVSSETIDELLGMSVVQDAPAKLESALQSALDARQYDAAFDVRKPIPIAIAPRVELITGPSGNGKSWALCRLAREALDDHRPAVLIRAADRAGLEREMKRLIAIEALDHQSPIEPSALGSLWRRHTEDHSAILSVFWEGCRNAEELRQIIYQNGLGEGLGLFAELPPEADAETFHETGVRLHETGEFTESELFEALRLRDVSAAAIPGTIRRMLRRPVLCGFYAQLAIEDGGWRPENEYRVLQRFWLRARDRGGQTAGARLKALAKKMVEKSSGEATDSEIVALGFSDDQLEQLTASGWLTQLSGKWRFAHDRLLTWAVAEWLVEQFSKPSVCAEEIASWIETLQDYAPEDRTRLHGLGFLMMDVLWLAATGNVVPAKLASLLALLEEDRQNKSDQSFYRELCPTIGPAILEGLLARSDMVASEDRDFGVAGNIAAAVRALQLPQDKQDQVIRRLADGGDSAWKLLLLLGSGWPLLAQRERVWESLVEAYRGLGTEQRNFAHFERLREAAIVICKADPIWLESKILGSTDAKSLGISAVLLREIAPAQDEHQWERLSSHLFKHMAPDDHARLVGFVRRVQDVSRIPFLIEQIEHGTHCGPDALAALAQMEPSKAFEVIATKPAMRYPPSAGPWLRRLLQIDPARTRELIDAWLMHVDPTGSMLALLWSEAKAEVGLTTIATLLDCLEAELCKEGGGDDRTNRTLLCLLGSPKLHPALDGAFHAKQNSQLANSLRTLLIGNAHGVQNLLADGIWTLFQKIGGESFESYVIGLLDGPFEQRAYGVSSSIFTPTDLVLEKLEAMAVDWSTEYASSLRESIWRILVCLKPEVWYPRMRALLSAGHDQEIALGLELFDDLGFVEDSRALLDCVRRTQPGSSLEARAINLASQYGETDPEMLQRALPRFNKEGDAEGHLAACNVLLKERGVAERALLDDYLVEFTSKTSWGSTDMQLLSIRLHQDDVPESLLVAAERFIKHRSFFGESVFKPYLDRGHAGAREIVLERAFSPPSIFTNEQADVIEALAQVDPAMAEEAFEQAWIETPRRQRYLVSASRKLGIRTLTVMLDRLPSKGDGQDSDIAFREICIEIRRRHEESLPLLRARYTAAQKSDRELLVKIISWLPEAGTELRQIIVTESDPDIRDLAENLLERCNHWANAVDAYRHDPASIANLQYALETVDPEMLYRLNDEWSISQLIQENGQQTLIAEDTFVRRFNKVAKTSIKSVRIRPRTRSATLVDED